MLCPSPHAALFTTPLSPKLSTVCPRRWRIYVFPLQNDRHVKSDTGQLTGKRANLRRVASALAGTAAFTSLLREHRPHAVHINYNGPMLGPLLLDICSHIRIAHAHGAKVVARPATVISSAPNSHLNPRSVFQSCLQIDPGMRGMSARLGVESQADTQSAIL